MTAPLHFESLVPSIFDTTVSAFKSGANEIANNLLMNLIFTLQEENNKIKSLITDLELEPTISLTLDTDEFHDSLIFLENILEKQVNISKKNKNNSDIFFEFYKICDESYTNVLILGNEVSAVASELRHKEFKLAS